MKTGEIIAELHDQNIDIRVTADSERLQLRPHSEVSLELLTEIERHKPELILLLLGRGVKEKKQ